MLTKNSNAGVNIAFQCIHIVITMTNIKLQWLNKHMNTSSTTTKKKTNSHKKTRIQTRIVLKYQLTYTVLFSNICLQIYNHLSTSYNTNQQQPAADYIHQLQYEPATTSGRLHAPFKLVFNNLINMCFKAYMPKLFE